MLIHSVLVGHCFHVQEAEKDFTFIWTSKFRPNTARSCSLFLIENLLNNISTQYLRVEFSYNWSLSGPCRSRWIIDTLSLFWRFLTTFLNSFLLIVLLFVFFSFLFNFFLFFLELLYLVCFSKCNPLQTYSSFTFWLFLFCLFFLLSLFYLLRLFLKLLSFSL